MWSAISQSGWRGRGDDDDWNPGVELLDGGDEIVAGHVDHAGVGDDSVEGGELAHCLDGLVAAVGRDDVELGGLNDKLAGGDAGGGFAIDDEKAGPDHASILRPSNTGVSFFFGTHLVIRYNYFSASVALFEIANGFGKLT